MTSFNNYLDTLVQEKGIDPDQQIEVQGPSGLNIMPLSVVLDAIKSTSSQEKKSIRDMLIKIDFQNGDVVDYFRHLAQAIAR